MEHQVRRTIGLSLLVSALCCTAAMADSVFVIEDPPVDFEVIDADPFDGIGDNGPYATFNDALLGTIGEARSMGEFDISAFSVPPGEHISGATFEVRITDIEVFGLGVDGETPDSLAVDGYIGDGIADLTDFQAGDGTILDRVATPDPWVGQVVSFDVTAFVTDLVGAQEPFVGLTVRAGSFGGLMMEEGAGFPKLTIETTLGSSAVDESAVPVDARLLRNTPNPFSVSTRIEYTVAGGGDGPAVVSIHDAAGRVVRVMQVASRRPGVRSVDWDGTDSSGARVASGVYFYQLRWSGKSETRRMLLIR